MFRSIQPFDKHKHSNLLLNPVAGYSFASQENFCPVFMKEMPLVSREYFICFPDDKNDIPLAVLGFEKSKNMYVSPDGTWRADYIPVFIRKYPFTLAKVEGQEEFTLAIDIKAPHLSETKGEPLVTAEGEPSRLVQDRIEMLKSIEKQRFVTQQAVREIEKAGLFKMEQMTVKSKGKQVSGIGGLRTIDEDKLKSWCSLSPGPALELVYAHLFSRVNLSCGIITGRKMMGTERTGDTFNFDDTIESQ